MNRSELIPGKVAALIGAAFVALMFVSLGWYSAPRSVSDAELVTWWSDSAHQRDVIISIYADVLAGIAFLVFLTALRSRLAAAEGGNAPWSSLVFAMGVVFVALLFAAGAPRGVIALTAKMTDEPLPGSDMLRYFPQIAYTTMGLFGGCVVASCVAITSALILKYGGLGRWLGWVGLVAAVGIAAPAVTVGSIFFPVLFVWVLATSVALWRAPAAVRLAGRVPSPA